MVILSLGDCTETSAFAGCDSETSAQSKHKLRLELIPEFIKFAGETKKRRRNSGEKTVHGDCPSDNEDSLLGASFAQQQTRSLGESGVGCNWSRRNYKFIIDRSIQPSAVQSRVQKSPCPHSQPCVAARFFSK
jgi:hypothetical protein